MMNNIINANQESKIPLFGLDFLGILDRGTNVLEVKPITICNLRCRYCFVSAGDYKHNFSIEPDYLIDWIKKSIEIKQCDDIEIHLSAYGEIMLYKPLYEFLHRLQSIKEIGKVTLQTNGLLLTPEVIQKLDELGVFRLNISLNSMDAGECATYCGVKKYDLNHLLEMCDLTLKSSMQLLIAPVWFKNINDQGILDIISYAKKIEEQGYKWPKFRLGIQNYLTYKTGRKIKRTHMKQFGYFYHLLHEMEKEHKLRLRLYAEDFGIHKTKAIVPPVKLGDIKNVIILRQGRWDNEFIALLDDSWGVKVISKVKLQNDQKVRVKFIKTTLHGNLLTAVPH